MKVIAIIQARMTSTRLPGKVLKKIMGKPLLSYQIERLRSCRSINEIIIATTINSDDDPIISLAKAEGLKYFRGSEEDVLDRYYQTAIKHHAKNIMRITGDCPLIESDICDAVAAEYFKSKADYARTGESLAEGLDCEMISFSALEVSWKNARLNSEREHVTLYIRNRPELFKIIVLQNERDDSKYRFTVDEPEDFEVVKAIIESLYKNSECFNYEDVINFLDENPKVFQKNSNIVRNEGLLISLKNDAVVK